MFTNAGNSEFSRDFYVQTDFDKTALDDIFGNFTKLKNMQKMFLLQHKQMRQPQIFLPELVFVGGEPGPKAPEP